MYNKARHEKGYVLVMALAIMVIGALLIGTMLSYLDTSLTLATKSEERSHIYYAADAGLEDALWNIQYNEAFTLPGDGQPEEWQLPEPINGKIVDVTVSKEPGAGDWIYRITSTATGDDGSSTVESYVYLTTTTIEHTSIEPLLAFDYAIFSGKEDLEMTGSTQVKSDPVQNEGNIYANGSITLKGSVKVYGDAIATDYIKTTGSATITGNRTQYLDPPLDCPSDADIQAMADQYKAKAEAGGTHNGDYTITGSGAYKLGPIHITGDLRISGSGVIQLQGTVYVDGNIDKSGSFEIAGPGTLLAEGRIDITGSGLLQPENLPVIISLSTEMGSQGAIKCTGSTDISAVLYAPYGRVKLSGSADIYGSVVGAEIIITGSRTITYCTDLGNREDLPGEEVIVTEVVHNNPEVLSYTIN